MLNCKNAIKLESKESGNQNLKQNSIDQKKSSKTILKINTQKINIFEWPE